MSRRPKLTSVVVADDLELGRVLDELFKDDPEHKRLTTKIARAQSRLKKSATKEAWHDYLLLEESVNNRLTFMLDVVATFAFEQGRRHQRRTRRG